VRPEAGNVRHAGGIRTEVVRQAHPVVDVVDRLKKQKWATDAGCRNRPRIAPIEPIAPDTKGRNAMRPGPLPYTSRVISLNAVRAALEREPGLRLAVLFGSGARGALTPDSDLDIGVAGVATPRLAALESVLTKVAGRPVDLVDLLVAPPLLRFEVARDGRLIVESVEHAWSDFRARAMVDWWDWAPTARVFHRAAAARLRGGVSHGAS
jgi:predicted nucleotidyltransferase